jgi:hypothetical protein
VWDRGFEGADSFPFSLFITWVFWLSGAAAITAALNGGLNCGRFNIPYCGQLNALEAFAWICWSVVITKLDPMNEVLNNIYRIMVTVMFFASLTLGFRAMRRGDGIKGPLAT